MTKATLTENAVVEIHSNGSKWAGEAPEGIETLIEVLGVEILDPRFEDRGGRFFRRESEYGTFRAFGNFLTRANVFNITGSLTDLLPLARAIKAARRRPEYLKAKLAQRHYRDRRIL